MNRTLTYPPEMTGFRPHGTVTAHVQSADGAIFHAVLGGIGDDKTTFRVWVWKEAPGGALSLIAITEPPNNSPSFVVRGGQLVLCGVRETAPGQREVVERDVPGFVPLSSAIPLKDIFGAFISRLGDGDVEAPLTKAVGATALTALHMALHEVLEVRIEDKR